MLDKKGIDYYLGGLSRVLNRWSGIAADQKGDVSEQRRLRDIQSIKGDFEPLLPLREYLLKQLRAIRRDESLLQRVSQHDIKEQTLTIDEKVLGAIVQVIANMDKLQELFASGWPHHVLSFHEALKLVDSGINQMRLQAEAAEKLFKKSEVARTLLHNSDIAEHDKEIHRILSELI